MAKFYYDFDLSMNTFLWVEDVALPEGVSLKVKDIAKIDRMPFRFVIWCRDPYRVLLAYINKKVIKELEIPEEMKGEDIIKCYNFVNTFFMLRKLKKYIFIFLI
jgi:hypothetical protein